MQGFKMRFQRLSKSIKVFKSHHAKMRKFLLLLIFVVVGAFFAMENSQTIGVSFILFNGPDLSSGFWLLLFLAGGVALGISASSLLIMSYRRKLARANKKD